MPWFAARTPKSVADDLIRFRKALRERAAHLKKLKNRDFGAEARIFVRAMRAKALHLERGAAKVYATRPDMRLARRNAASALIAAAELLENRVFADGEESVDLERCRDALRAAADLLKRRIAVDFGHLPSGKMWYPEGRPEIRR